MSLAIERDSKNIYLRIELENGSFELADDGEGLNLQELSNESILLKSNEHIIC